MQNLLIFQSLWGMERLRGQPATAALEARVERAAAAGFDGITHHWYDRAVVAPLATQLRALGLDAEGQCFPRTVDELWPAVELANEFGIHHVTIQADVRPRDFRECVRILEGWCRIAETSRVPVYLETHRGRLNNDLLRMLDLLDAVPHLKLLADLSHYVVAREFPLPPLPDEMDGQVREVLDRCWAAHARVASPGQVQVEISFPHHRPLFEQFLGWWDYLMRSWRRRAGADDSLAFTCELGPWPYAIQGPDGQDQSDRWAEALQLREALRARWQAAAAPAAVA